MLGSAQSATTGTEGRADADAVEQPGTATFASLTQRLPAAQKSAKGAPAYSRFVNRKAGGYLAVAAYRLRASPNQVTAASALCTFAGILAMASLPPSWPLGLAVCSALLMGYALDSADGQLARLRGGGSTSGEWLDHVIDSAKIPALHLAVLVSAFRFQDLAAAWLLIPAVFGVVHSVLFFAMILNDQMRRARRRSEPQPARTAGAGQAPPSVWRSLAVTPTDYGLLCLVFALLGFTAGFNAAYTALFAAHLLFVLAALPKWFAEMDARDRVDAEPACDGRG